MSEIRVRINQQDIVGDMPLLDTVIYDDNLDNRIGKGMVGAIYSTHDGRYVVKVPHTPATLTEFKTEYNILKSLWERYRFAERVPLPSVAWGQRDDMATDGGVLVMPYYASLLSRSIQHLLADGNWIAAEEMAVRAALDYARVMETVRMLQRSCTDRKVKDFFLDEQGRLIIIDWNVLNPATPDFLAAELQVFGQLWHQLLLERIGSPPFKPFNDLLWLPREYPDVPGGFPSVGLRAILAVAVHTDIQRRFVDSSGYPSHTPLRRALEVWLALLVMNADELANNQPSLLDELSNLLPAPAALSPEECETVWADLAWRVAGCGEQDKENRDTLVSQFITRGFDDPHSREIVARLERDELDAAYDYVNRLLRPASTSGYRHWDKG